MRRAFIGLGSNLGDRLGFLRRAVRGLEAMPVTTVRGWSSIYETEPLGKVDQPFFLNMVVELETDLEPVDLHMECKAIERKIGRTKRERWGPREIDLDLVYCGEVSLVMDELTIPHPEAEHRRFVLVPMLELAPDFTEPLRGRSIAQLLESCEDRGSVTKTNLTIDSNLVEA